MSDSRVVEILKKAIILERQGYSFYKEVADRTESEAVKNIFSIMAEEEQKHEALLISQAERFQRGDGFYGRFGLEKPNEFVAGVLSPRIREQITASGYEAAAISAAVAMEEKAVELYSGRAEESDDETEKGLYRELARWEKTHLSFLNEIYQDLLESSWYDSNFWPF